ncbi:MAG: OB-fold domain-containing protein [Actinomycetota bacterium]|nr:OB-fold domain-containing protein [Actinomycetota bacterium]
MTAPPAPDRDTESGPFWQGLAQHRLLLQECPACRRRRFPRMPTCPYCGTDGGEEVEPPGTGTVYSWVRVERALTPAAADQVPYCVATVDLDGGGRIHGRLEPPAAARIGMAVTPVYVDHDDWTELRFAGPEGGG